MLETVSLYGHIIFFFVTIIPLWIMCPKNSAHEVFIHVTESGGWGNIGLACCVSMVTVLYCNLVSHTHLEGNQADPVGN